MAAPGIDARALREWERITAGPTARIAAPLGWAWLRGMVRLSTKVLAVALLPLLALVRVAVFLYAHAGYPTAPALVGGILCTTVVLAVYGAWLWHRLTGRVRFALVARRIALPLVLAYSGYALLYLASANAKSARVQAYYDALHPLLRVAISTLVLVHHHVVVTDLVRRPEDYSAMGLPVNDGTLHYVQSDGYAHAADLRTAGRTEIGNRLVQLYFWAMGFATLRHMGSADHLHVELPLR